MRKRFQWMVPLSVLLLNAACILCFRFFTTVDGPVHVLMAALQDEASAGNHRADGFSYMPYGNNALLGHWLLRGLLSFARPELAHDIAAVLVSCVVILGVMAYLRAHGTRSNLAVLWLAPLMWSNLLIMGLFHFMLGAAVAFYAVAWWKWQAHSPRVRWLGPLLGLIIAVYTHRSAHILLAMVLLPTFLIERFASAGDARRMRGLAAILVLGLLVAVASTVRSIGWSSLLTSSLSPAYLSDFLMQPLILLERAQELELVRGIAIAFVAALIAGAVARWKMGRALAWHDALLALALGFMLMAWMGDTWRGREHLITGRSQWLALLVLPAWLIAMADASPGWVRRVIGITALFALPVHAVRLVRAEAYLASFAEAHKATLQAADALAPGQVVLTVPSGTDRLLQHEAAYMALRYSGILITPREHMRLRDPNPWTNRPPWSRMAVDRHWVLRHWRAGLPPEVGQVLFLGADADRMANRFPWPKLLDRRYRLTYTNDQARIYTRDDDDPPALVPLPAE